MEFGLGAATGVIHVVIRWPSGIRQTLPRLEMDRFHDVQEPFRITGQMTPGRDVELTWDIGALQQSDGPHAAWQDVPGATSPQTVSPSNDSTLYRVRF